MTRLTLHLIRLTSRLPVARAAFGYALAAPAYVLWGGSGADIGVRLRVAGLAAAAVPALVWDDRCAPLTASTPVGLPSVRRLRILGLIGPVAAGWGLAAYLADRTDPGLPVTTLAVEAMAATALVAAVVGVLAVGREGEPVATYPIPVLLTSLLLASRLPERWSLLALAPGSPGADDVLIRLTALLLVSALAVAWLFRDPATRRQASLLSDRHRRGAA